jgi:hypothetical protein
LSKQPTPNNRKAAVKKLNELYIQTRKKYLVQFPDSYTTLDRDKSEKVRPLNDGMVANHLKGSYTYGIFNGGYTNKFITFVVDCKDAITAKWATYKLVNVLNEDFSISHSDIHVSISGGKGYHVDLFFNKPIALAAAQTFHAQVIREVGPLNKGEIEFRPTFTQGVKLPLGIHRKTERRCWYCDPVTLEPLEEDASYEYLAQIEPMDPPNIDLTQEQAQEFTEIVEKTDITVNVADREAGLKRAVKILEAGQLLESNTRHKVTFDLARFCNEQGIDEGEAIDMITAVLLNTPRDYFSTDSKPEYWRSEAERLVKFSYERNYTLGNADIPITVYKSEILAVLSCGTFRTKQMLYAMLVTSKRYGRSFYFARSTAMKMIGTNSRDTANRTIKKLSDGGYVEHVRKGEIDKARSRQVGHVFYKPNKYRLLIHPAGEADKSVEVTPNESLIDVVYLLCDTKEVKQYVKRTEFDSKWRINA